jgi:hypothetical protein
MPQPLSFDTLSAQRPTQDVSNQKLLHDSPESQDISTHHSRTSPPHQQHQAAEAAQHARQRQQQQTIAMQHAASIEEKSTI